MTDYSERLESEQYSLSQPETFSADHLRIAVAASGLGAAAQVLGAFQRLASKQHRYQTFASLAKIAEVACVRESVARTSIRKLIAAGYVARLGRDRRRTVTYELTGAGRELYAERKYLVMPRAILRAFPDLPWSQKLMLAAVADEATLGGRYDRPPQLTIAKMVEKTGLSLPSVKRARAALRVSGLLTDAYELADKPLTIAEPMPKNRPFPATKLPQQGRLSRSIGPGSIVASAGGSIVASARLNPSIAVMSPLSSPKERTPKLVHPADGRKVRSRLFSCERAGKEDRKAEAENRQNAEAFLGQLSATGTTPAPF